MSNPYAPPEPGTGAPPDRSTPPDRGAPPVPPGPRDPARRPQRQQPAGPPPAPVRPPDPEALARARRLSWSFSLLLLASIVAGTFPVPWVLVSFVLVVATLVVGVRAVLAVNRAGSANAPLVAVLGVGLFLCVASLLGAVQLALTWDLQLERQQCAAEAITVSAQTGCAASFEKGVEQRLQQLQRTARG